MPRSLYFNIEDDNKSIIDRISRENGDRFVLVFPRKSYLFADSVNLKLLKKQLDISGITASILTMDEKGQAFAHEAGFSLVDIPKRSRASSFSDIRVARPETEKSVEVEVKPKPSTKPKKTSVKSEKVAVEKPAEPPIRIHKNHNYIPPAIKVEESIFDEVPHKPTSSGGTTFRFNRKSKWFVWLIGVAAVVLVVALVITVALPSAVVAITPKSENIVRQLELSASTEYSASNSQLLQLPAKPFEAEIAEENSFATSGKKELGTKATGMVRIFNLSGTSLNLKTATTSLKSGDKEYLLTTDALFIPNLSAKSATAPDAGFLARLEATGFGESYNLSAGSKLEISNQVFGNKPDVLYAVVEDGITGGSSRFISEIQDIDLETSKEILVDQALEKISKNLKLSGSLLPEDGFALEVIEFTTDMPKGTETTNFKATLKAKLSGLTFQPEELQVVIRSRVEQVLPEGTKLQMAEKDKLTFKVTDQKIDLGSMKVSVYLESKLYRTLDSQNILESLPGQDIEAVIGELKGRADVENVQIDIFPKLRKKLPVLKQRIDLNVLEQ